MMRSESFPLTFVCPRCHSPLEMISEDELCCVTDGLAFQRQEGIWRFLLPEDEARYARFIQDYETIRKAEGRGSADPAYYRALPDRDLTGRFTQDWRFRAASFQLLTRQILPTLEERGNGRLKILDLGAGVGWLSNRLAARGHYLAAIDLTVNAWDGLGAYIHYENSFLPVQADYNRLPLPDRSVDLVVFNASFHYATSFDAALRECLRVLQPGGLVVVLDTPVYRRDESGRRMVGEREDSFQRLYGFPSNALPSENYLTPARLEELAAGLGIRWKYSIPVYPLSWSVKHWIARLRSRRELARFPMIAGTLNQRDQESLTS